MIHPEERRSSSLENSSQGNEDMKLTYTPPAGYDRPRKNYDITTQKAEARDQAIDKLVTDATTRGDCTDRFYWMLVFDMEMAQMTTNAAQLLDIGIDTATASLWEIVNGLADLGIYLLNTNHIDDTELLARLKNEITQEPVRDLPPNYGVNEFVDIKGGSLANSEAIEVCDRDQYLPKVSNEPMEDESETHAEQVKKKQGITSKTMSALVTKKAKANVAAASKDGAN